jgi:hypothetical protein
MKLSTKACIYSSSPSKSQIELQTLMFIPSAQLA